ncbi:MAG: hypothetical protein H7Z19_00345, partial [Chitinophagaceae bacterium]|nr:hypothetical protein [Rubrivivax sp.]
MKRLIALTAVSAGLGLLATTPARADLVYLGPQTFSGSGLGAFDTVLTLQSPGNSSFAAGSVGREV